VTASRRLAAAPLVPILLIGLALLAAACGSSAPATSAPSARPSVAASTGASPALTQVPGGPASPVIGPTVGPPTTTDTEFGPIFDALPPSFPTLPGQEPAETGAGAASGSFAVNLTVAEASQAMQTALTAAGWSVDAGSPREDGSDVLDATLAPAGCK
jgi:hypothetical protein